MTSGKRIKKIDARFTEEEFNNIVALEKALGVRRTEIIRMRVLNNSAQMVINAKEMIQCLDSVGASLGRAGNNINQLARYANTLNKRGLLSPQIIERSNQVMADYITHQGQLEIILRKIIRSMNR